MKYKSYLLLLLMFFGTSYSIAQNSKFDFVLGNNIAFASSIKRITPESIYKFNKNNTTGHDLISVPNYNIGLNYEYKISHKFSIFTGIHTARTETELYFQNFNSNYDGGTFVWYGYSVNTFEFPIGICYSKPILNKIILRNYLTITINLNNLSRGAYHYRLAAKNSPTDTLHLAFTEIEGFPSGNSFGFRYGIGVIPFKKFTNLEIGAYINLQFNRSLTWDQEVVFANISKNEFEYHHATLKDKPDYINFHLKYNFLRF